MTSVKLAAKFLFNVCLHTKKNLRYRDFIVTSIRSRQIIRIVNLIFEGRCFIIQIEGNHKKNVNKTFKVINAVKWCVKSATYCINSFAFRGSANEWYEALTIHLRHSKAVRNWFALNVLFKYPTRFAEYLLECPSTEVRGAFMKILVFIAHFSQNDGPFTMPTTMMPGKISNLNCFSFC